MNLRFGSSLFGLTCLVVACGSTTDSQQQAADAGSDVGTGSSSGAGSGSGSGGGSGSSSGSGSGGSSGNSSGNGSGSSSGSSSGGFDGGFRTTDAAISDATSADSNAEASDGGGTTEGDAGTCGTCGVGSVCVKNQTIGGRAQGPDDAGRCPSGLVIVPEAPGFCSSPPTFHCATLPSTCTTSGVAPAHCTCAPKICTLGEICTDLSPTLMRCLLAAP